MLRLVYVIIVNVFRIVYYVPKMSYCVRHRDRYSEEYRYILAKRLVNIVIRTSRVETEHIGVENLPLDGGYIMFANHQGRYDPLGIISGHEKPCSFLLDKKRADGFLSGQFAELLDGISIDKDSVKDQMRAIRELSENVKHGKRYLVFPEGRYQKGQGNSTLDFKQGCFIAATHAKCPIVPVTLIDSYKVYGNNSLKKVKTKVIYHKPICYDEYSGMKTKNVAVMVKDIIDKEISARTNIN